MLDLIARSEGLDRVRDVLEEARSFLSLSRPEPTPDRSTTEELAASGLPESYDGCSRWHRRFRGQSRIRAIAVAATAWARIALISPARYRTGIAAAASLSA